MLAPAMPILLFVYGTLHPDRAPRAIAHVARRLRPIGEATIRGRLLDLGEYPALLLAERAQPEDNASPQSDPEEIPGAVFEVPDLATLAQLDAYEDFRPGDPEASLFLRVEAPIENPVTLPDGSPLRCWVYVYNRPEFLGAPLMRDRKGRA